MKWSFTKQENDLTRRRCSNPVPSPRCLCVLPPSSLGLAGAYGVNFGTAVVLFLLLSGVRLCKTLLRS